MKYRGLFWKCGSEGEHPGLLCKKVLWDDTETKLNHQREWANFDKRLTGGYPFNHFPRGRVENYHGKVRIFLNPCLCSDEILDEVKREFGLTGESLEIQVIADGSSHYSAEAK